MGEELSAFPLQRIAIIGGGAVGWLGAATLARVLRGSCAIELLEIPDEAANNGAIASVPSLHRLFRLLALDEASLMRATQATYRLGAQFRDWGAPGQRYFHGFGSIGAKLDAVQFQHHWLRLAASGECPAFEEFSIAAQAARVGRFALPHADPRSVLSLFSYAWHFDAGMLAVALRDHALKAGVSRTRGEVAAVELEPEHGYIRSLALTDGTRLSADLYIDCSGARGLLGSALEIAMEDWSAWLPCDRIQTLRCAPDESLPPYSENIADSAGWHANVPLQHATVRSFAYSREFIDDDAARARLLALAGAGALDTPRRQTLMRGRPREFWTRNCLLLPGDALDPLESVSLHLAQTGITRFLAHFPVRKESAADRNEYNRLTCEEYDRIRDLLALHFHASAREDSPFWERCRNMAVPEGLARKLSLFADSGRVSIGEDEHCGVDGWLAVLLGQGIRPRTWDPLAQTTPLANMRSALTGMAAEMRARVQALPTHREFIAARGVAAPSPTARA